jgi:hypothetical protein
MIRSGSGLGSDALMSKSGKFKETLSSLRGLISKIFEEGTTLHGRMHGKLFFFLRTPS